MQRMKKYFGTAEIVIWPNEKSPNWLFRIRRMERLRERFDYVVGFGAGVIITVLASVGPALNSSKINIIEAIKYE